MHAENAENVVKKVRYQRKSFEEVNRKLKFINRNFRRTNLKNKRSDRIHIVLSVLISDRTQKMLNEKIRVLSLAIIVLNK